MAIRAYPEQFVKQVEEVKAVPNTENKGYIIVYQSDDWNYIIKAITILGAIVVLSLLVYCLARKS